MKKPLAVITGASSGIGAATAKAFSKAGYPTLLIARRLDIMESFKLENSMCRKVDVRDREALIAAIREAEKEYGPTDMIFNNAGVARLAEIGTQDPSEWDEMIDVNTKGVMNGIYAVMSDMKARKGGTIVNMSSIAGRKIYEDHTVYCGTKFFVHAISESIRGYLSPHNVRVIVMSPGNIEAEVLNGITDPNTLEAYKKNIERIGGRISPDYVAKMILFAYEMPQNVIMQEVVVTPTKQDY
ncbi:MAG: oxidoreductase [Pelagibacteraceae bacterium]|jgi:NADP-dependent 3-hydroxy acid dehydrogenase YdfG|nr:MAG: oxidoreductase [Pelagibacteraceae bacterium]|tara:strand:+ start:215 stop:937 length:723 start_codon:yes stop_codon:yes gene_type:complete